MSTQTPGGLGPPNVYRRFFNSAGEVLLKREPTGSLGIRGYPGGVFASFCRYELKLGQKDVAAHSMFFLEGLRSLCADNPPYPSFSGLACGPPSFFTRRKKAKTCQGGNPLEPRVILIFRAIVGHHNNGEADTRTGPYHKVPQGFEPS